MLPEIAGLPVVLDWPWVVDLEIGEVDLEIGVLGIASGEAAWTMGTPVVSVGVLKRRLAPEPETTEPGTTGPGLLAVSGVVRMGAPVTIGTPEALELPTLGSGTSIAETMGTWAGAGDAAAIDGNNGVGRYLGGEGIRGTSGESVELPLPPGP